MILYGNQGIMVTTESLGIVAFSGAFAGQHGVQQTIREPARFWVVFVALSLFRQMALSRPAH